MTLLKQYDQLMEFCDCVLTSFVTYIIAKFKLLQNQILCIEQSQDRIMCTEPDLEVGELTSAPLSHSAARHKMAVRPKRTHGAPRRSRRLTQVSLLQDILQVLTTARRISN